MDIREAGINGIMFKFIQNFLKPRTFKVKVNEVLSDTKVQTEDILQGSRGSRKFFIPKINKTVAKLPNAIDFRYHFTWMISRYPTVIQIGRLLRENSKTV